LLCASSFDRQATDGERQDRDGDQLERWKRSGTENAHPRTPS